MNIYLINFDYFKNVRVIMNKNALISELNAKNLDTSLSVLYGDQLEARRERLTGLVNDFAELYGVCCL